MQFRQTRLVSKCKPTLFALSGAVAMMLTAAPSIFAQESRKSLAETPARSPFSIDFSSDNVPTRFSLDMTSKKSCQVPLPSLGSVSPFPLALRLGITVSPVTKFIGGVDVTLNGLKLLPGFSSRVDADVILELKRSGDTTLIPVTFDQIYSKNIALGSRIYVGGGLGAYIGNNTRFGGKLLVGAGLKQNLGVEGTVHFSGRGDTILTVQARVGL